MSCPTYFSSKCFIFFGVIALRLQFVSLPICGFAQPAGLDFEVASIKESRPGETAFTNFPLGPGPEYKPGGSFVAIKVPVVKFVEFALKPTNYQIGLFRSEMPSWTREAMFDVVARAEGNPTKDEMRRMMQSLLEKRFHMSLHHEIREINVFALTLVKEGKTGPQLRPHSADDPNCEKRPLPKSAPDGNPSICGVSTVIHPSAPNLFAIGGHNVPISSIAALFPGLRNNVDRPVLDETGLSGAFDYSLEWAPESGLSDTASLPEADTLPTFIDALREQLGLKLTAKRGRVDVIVIDRIERPTAN